MSPVQVYAITVLHFINEQEKEQESTIALKRALATRPEFKVEKLFPDYFPPKENVGLPEGDVAHDYAQVEWKSPKDDKEGWEKISKMLAEKAGFLSGDEVVEMPTTGEIEWTNWQ